jgi:prevent-host-death family protein
MVALQRQYLMHQVTVQEAQSTIKTLLDEALQGEQIVITVGNRPALRLEPYAPDRKPGSAKGEIWMSDDFDEPLEDFKEYM